MSSPAKVKFVPLRARQDRPEEEGAMTRSRSHSIVSEECPTELAMLSRPASDPTSLMMSVKEKDHRNSWSLLRDIFKENETLEALSMQTQDVTFQFSWFASKGGDFFDKKLKSSLRAISSHHTWLIFCSQSPFSAMITSPYIQASTLVMVLYLFWSAIASIASLSDETQAKYSHFKFTPLELRDPAASWPSSPSIGDLALLWDGCDITDPQPTRRIENTSHIIISYEEKVTINGWLFETSDKDPALDPVRFTLEGSNDLDSWDLLAESRSCRVWRRQSSSLRFALPESRETVSMFDWTSADCLYPFYLANAVGQLIGTTAIAAAGICGFINKGRLGTKLLVYIMLFMVLFREIGGAILASTGRWDRAFIVLWECNCFWIWPGTLTIAESRFLELMLIESTLVAVGQFLDLFLIRKRLSIWMFPIIGTMFMPAMLICIREYMRWIAKRNTLKDQEAFDGLWDRISNKPAISAQIEWLTKTEEAMQRRIARVYQGETVAQRLQSTILDPEAQLSFVQSPVFENFVGQHCKAGHRVSSLDQLYAQATTVYPMIQAKVQEWAEISGGSFMSNGSLDDGYITWNLAKSDRESLQLIKWTSIKDINRSIQKIARSYGSDPSKLMDVCRERIIFNNLGDLTKCFEFMAKDRDVEVVKVVNRFRLSHESLPTAGYRDVRVNLKIVNHLAISRGVNGHVCEVQLALKDFQELCSEEQHERYIGLRNVRDYRDLRLGRWFSKLVPKFLRPRSKRQRADLADEVAQGLRSIRTEPGDRSTSHTQLPLMSRSTPAPSIEDPGSIEMSLTSPSGTPSLSQMGRHGSEHFDSQSLELSGSGGLLRESEVGFSEMLEREGLFSAQASMISSVLLQRNLWPGNVRNRILREVRQAFKLVGIESVFYSSNPMEAALSKRRVQVVGLALCLIGAYVATLKLWDLGHDYTVTGRHFRFQPLTLRNQSSPADLTEANVLDFGLTMRGCEVKKDANLSWSDLEGVVVSFEEPILCNGWWFKTGGPEGLDPVWWQVDYSMDKSSWHPMASGPCTMLHPWGSANCWAKFYNTSLTRSYEHRFTLKFPWYATVGDTVNYFVVSLGGFAAVLSGFLQQPKLGTYIFNTFVFISALLFLTAAFGSVLEQDGLDSVVWVVRGFLNVALAGIVAFGQRYLLPFLIFYGLSNLAISYALLTIVAGVPDLGDFLVGSAGPTVPAFPAITSGIGVVFLIMRQITVYRSRSRIRHDKKCYDSIWKEILANPESRAKLENLDQVAAKLSKTETQARQVMRTSDNRDVPMLFLNGKGTSHYQLSEESRVASLDQLYAQAAGIYHIFLRVVQGVAERNGLFLAYRERNRPQSYDSAESHLQSMVESIDLSQRSIYVKWADAKKTPALAASIKWPGLKRIDRAIEKLNRSYRCDISKLLDVCRQCIVYEEIDDISRCLEVLARDLDVDIVRVKNRLHPSYDSWKSAGYRDVLVNLRIVNEATRKLGVDGHVCELQLVLKGFMDLRSDNGHLRFVKFRNSRGE